MVSKREQIRAMIEGTILVIIITLIIITAIFMTNYIVGVAIP